MLYLYIYLYHATCNDTRSSQTKISALLKLHTRGAIIQFASTT